jgi:hypothetical protein
MAACLVLEAGGLYQITGEREKRKEEKERGERKYGEKRK